MPDAPEGRDRRQAGSRAFIFVTALVVIALAVVLGVTAYRRVSAQSAAREDVAEARRLIESVDKTVKRVDDLVRAQASATISDEVGSVIDELPSAKQEATEAAALLAGAAPTVAKDERETVLRAVDAARLRWELLDAARPILEATEKASLAVGPAEEGWKLLISAEEHSDKAATLYNAHDKKKAKESRDLSKQAAEEVTKARTLLDKANLAMPEAGLAPILAYCDGRLELLKLADEADAAFLGGKIAEANTISEKYNAKEKQLTASAKSLPPSPTAAIATAYEKLTSAASGRYNALRERLNSM